MSGNELDKEKIYIYNSLNRNIIIVSAHSLPDCFGGYFYLKEAKIMTKTDIEKQLWKGDIWIAVGATFC